MNVLVVLVLVLVFCVVFGAVTGLLAWLLMAVLRGFDVQASYWPCFGAVLLAELLLGGRSRS